MQITCRQMSWLPYRQMSASVLLQQVHLPAQLQALLQAQVCFMRVCMLAAPHASYSRPCCCSKPTPQPDCKPFPKPRCTYSHCLSDLLWSKCGADLRILHGWADASPVLQCRHELAAHRGQHSQKAMQLLATP